MTTGANIQINPNTDKAAAKAALEEHIERLPTGTRLAHNVMAYLLLASFILILASFAYAMYVSFNWKAFQLVDIPFWWMVNQACAALVLVTLGLDAILVKAYYPLAPMIGGSFSADVFSGEKTLFVTGSSAVKWGLVMAGLGLLWAALWGGMYLFASASADPMKIFISFVVVVSIGTGVVSGLQSLIQRRRK